MRQLTVMHCVTCLAFVGHAQSLLHKVQQSCLGVLYVSFALVSFRQILTSILPHLMLPSAQDKQETTSSIIQGFMLGDGSRKTLSNAAQYLWGSIAEKTMV